VVQGVGFRPFVHRLAVRHRLAGWVRNTAGDVEIVLEGRAKDVDAFAEALEAEAPPLARIERVVREPHGVAGRTGFVIAPSALDEGSQPVSPDVGTCAACERELFEPKDRRFRYPFITCTDCGPRFSVIQAMPYDRERTSMRVFPQCPACKAEYGDPQDRRYHSETNSCAVCGPRLWLADVAGDPIETDRAAAIAAAANLLMAGRVVAVRGLGGYHLAADATDEAAVRRLRERKHREAKPLAIMVRTLDEARAIADVSDRESEQLVLPERPIVILRRRAGVPLAASLAPGLDSIGVMLAYTPLHHLLLDAVKGPLVMTSGNRSDEPIAMSNDDALRRLGDIADAFLMHDREIVARYDDSVVRVEGGARLFLRRARGYAPLPLDLPVASPTVLVAVGPHLKNTFTLVTGARAWVGQHIGDLEDMETLEHFRAALALYRSLFRADPEVAVRDLHPGYLSTRIAEELGLERVIAVQHHHAHVAAVMAEHLRTKPVVGLAFDGTGYGDDGAVWGAECLVADLGGYRRMGRLRYAPLPGGDLAARRPWRVALGYLSLERGHAPDFAYAVEDVPDAEVSVAETQIARKLNAPLASSLGRLFDAAASVLGVRQSCDYEGQAAMELEALAGARAADPLPVPMAPEPGGCWVLDPAPLLAELGRRRLRGEDAGDLAAVFHESVAEAAAELAFRVASGEGLDTVALGGGCFQNARLLGGVRERLERRHLAVLVPRRLSPNDGAISYGQAAVAAALLQREETA
jgi:hydrogenase maturation protein HypF